MDDDIVFKVPEKLSLDEQKNFVRRSVEYRRWADPLLLRMPAAVLDVAEASLAQDANDPANSHEAWQRNLNLLLSLDDGDVGTTLQRIGQNPDRDVRDHMGRMLERTCFEKDRSYRQHDLIAEGRDCRAAHQQRTESFHSWTCHYQLKARLGIPTKRIEMALAALFNSDRPNSDVAKMLGALGTDEAAAVLVQAAFGELDVDSPGGQLSHREMALGALRQVKSPEMTAVYRQVFSRQRSTLSQTEIAYCLSGLWTNGDPKSKRLVRRIEAHCRVSDMPQGRQMAQNILVNRLRVREPLIFDDMNLGELEREMGCKGEVLGKLDSSGEAVVKYQWGSGVATMKGDRLAKWKPTDS